MKVDARELQLLARRLALAPNAVRRSILQEAQTIGYDYVRYVRTQKLSGQVLNRRSGKLSNHVTMQVQDQGTQISLKAGVFGGVPYARPHEYGYKGEVEVRPYERKDGTHVSGHTRQVDMPERSYLRRSLLERHQEYAARLLAAATPLRKRS